MQTLMTEMLQVLKDINRVTMMNSKASHLEQTAIFRQMRDVITKAENIKAVSTTPSATTYAIPPDCTEACHYEHCPPTCGNVQKYYKLGGR